MKNFCEVTMIDDDMTDNIITTIFILFAIVTIFAFGAGYGTITVCRNDNQLICKQLYQKDTSAYINCNAKSTEENIRLIKDTSNDR